MILITIISRQPRPWKHRHWASCWAARVDRIPPEQLSSPHLKSLISDLLFISPGSPEQSPEERHGPCGLLHWAPKKSPSAQHKLTARITGIACYTSFSSSSHFFQDLRGCRSHLLSAHLGIHRSTMSKSRTLVLAFCTQHQLCCPRLCPNTITESK